MELEGIRQRLQLGTRPPLGPGILPPLQQDTRRLQERDTRLALQGRTPLTLVLPTLPLLGKDIHLSLPLDRRILLRLRADRTRLPLLTLLLLLSLELGDLFRPM